MRVLFVTHNFPRATGDLPGSFLLHLAVALRELDVAVHVIAPHAGGLSMSDSVSGIPVTRFRYAPDARETLAYTGTMAAQVAASWRAKLDLLAFIRAASRTISQTLAAHPTPIDVVHAHWWFPAGLSAGQRARHRRPLVTTLHGSDVRLARGAVGRMLMRRVLAQSAQVTAVSNWLAAEAVRVSGGARPVVAPMPVATDLFEPGNAPRDGVLFVGKLDAQKGASILLAALAHAKSPITATFVGDGPDARMLRAQAASLGVAGRVRWCGALPHEALPDLYRAARVVVAPATEPEGLGLVAAEALLCETPVIASNIGGLPDLVADDITGRLVPPRDPSALAVAIDAAMAAPSTLAAWGRAGRSRVLANFGPSACAARYRAAYEEALRGRH